MRSTRKLTIKITLDQPWDMDILSIKESVANRCEQYGRILRVDVEQEPTPYEQMQMGFPRSELERIVRQAERRANRGPGE